MWLLSPVHIFTQELQTVSHSYSFLFGPLWFMAWMRLHVMWSCPERWKVVPTWLVIFRSWNGTKLLQYSRENSETLGGDVSCWKCLCLHHRSQSLTSPQGPWALKPKPAWEHQLRKGLLELTDSAPHLKDHWSCPFLGREPSLFQTQLCHESNDDISSISAITFSMWMGHDNTNNNSKQDKALCSKHYSKIFTSLNSLTLHNILWGIGYYIPIFQMKNLRRGEDEKLASDSDSEAGLWIQAV